MTSGGALTLERGLGLLDLVAGGVDRLDDLTRRSGLSRSVVHRMLTSFVRLQYLTLGSDNRYRPGVKLLDLGARAEQTLNLPAEVNAVLTRLSEETSDACHLGIRVDADVLYLAKARGHRGIDMASHP
jgi:IclR family acetate operon transcriptional repressor